MATSAFTPLERSQLGAPGDTGERGGLAVPSLTFVPSHQQQYVLRIADTCLIQAQRLSEWCGHAPVLEEDLALTNMAQDLIGQARALLTHIGAAQGISEDQLAYLRDERAYRNLTLVELPNNGIKGNGPGGDFALTVLRNLMVASWLKGLWQRLVDSSDEEVAAIAGKALKEARYHQQHYADWTVRLGDGTPDSHARMQSALKRLWPYTAELFDADEVDAAAAAAGLGPSCAELETAWASEMTSVLQEATLTPPKTTAFLSTGKRGVHSEHMGYLLADMQSLQRAFPGGVW
jgi:ring-1,2-phenylacetyl-CoA epoxidase subunit PaaC